MSEVCQPRSPVKKEDKASGTDTTPLKPQARRNLKKTCWELWVDTKFIEMLFKNTRI